MPCLRETDLQLALLTEATLENASLAKTAMTECFDLTLAQLQSARDSHLSFCPDPLRMQLRTLLKSGSEASAEDSAQNKTLRNSRLTGAFEPGAPLGKAPSMSPLFASPQWA